ncbi:putative ATP-dependent RNA helicase DHR1, partial [Coemansia sp. RSA 2049]
MARSDPSVRLYVSERDPDEVGRQADRLSSAVLGAGSKPQPEESLGKRKRKRNKKGKGDSTAVHSHTELEDSRAEIQGASTVVQKPVINSGSSDVSDTKAVAEPAVGSALASATVVKRKRQKKGHILKKLGLSRHQDEDSEDEYSDVGEEPRVAGLTEAGHGSDQERKYESDSEFDSSASESDIDGDEQGINIAKGSLDAEPAEPEHSQERGEKQMQRGVIEQNQEPQAAQEKNYYMGSMLKPLLSKRGIMDTEPNETSEKKAYYINIKRSESIQEQRAKLPVYAEEQQIMEAIADNPVLVLSGETGSGKTTQVPQFLFEAGYGDPGSPNPGMIGITQPRRVAAMSMSSRVAEELGDFGHTVAHQVRFDTTVSDQTRIKFMTEGVLLREMASDLLLTKYSALIIDEAHERTLNTDILLG